jgi:hypothetical protein
MIKVMLYIDDCDDCRGELHNLLKEEAGKKNTVWFTLANFTAFELNSL